jgi:hypothetical protein
VSSLPPDGLAGARGVVRLLNTAGGRVLCLAGEVDAAAVDRYVRTYGREPAQVDVIDAGSVTALSEPAVEFLLDHLAMAQRAGRAVPVRCSAQAGRTLARAGLPAPVPRPETGRGLSERR